MKLWICPDCGRRGDSEDKVIIRICNVCQVEMEVVERKEVGYGKKI